MTETTIRQLAIAPRPDARIDPTPIDHPPIDPVTSHVRCTGCAYDLFRQDSRGRCPECGRDVFESLGVDLLSVDPIIVARLQSGARWLLARTMLATACATFAAICLMGAKQGPMTVLVFLAMIASEWRAVNLLVTLEEKSVTLLRALGLLAAAGEILLMLALLTWFRTGAENRLMLAGLGFACLAFAGARYELLHRILARIAQRAGDRTLADELRGVGTMATLFNTLLASGIAMICFGTASPLTLSLGILAAVVGLVLGVCLWVVAFTAHIALLRKLNRVAAR